MTKLLTRSAVAAVLLLAAGQQQESGTFRLTQQGIEVATEKFTRTAVSLESDLRIVSSLRVTFAARLLNGAVSNVTLSVYPLADSTKPAQTARVRFTADSMVLETTREGRPVTERWAAPRGVVPYLHPSVVWLEEVVKRARTQTGPVVRVPVAVISRPQQVTTATVTFASPTRARVQILQADMRVTLDAEGRIVRAESPADSVLIERR